MRSRRTGRFIPLLVCLFVLLGMTFALTAFAEVLREILGEEG